MKAFCLETNTCYYPKRNAKILNEDLICAITGSEIDDMLSIISNSSYDVILIDARYKNDDNENVLNVVKKINSSSFKGGIIVTEFKRSDSELKVDLYNNGADMVLDEGIPLNEITARVRATVRRRKGLSSPMIRIGNLSINIQTKEIVYNNKILNLTDMEYRVFELLSMNLNNTISKETFMDHLYVGDDEEPEPKIIDVYLCKLRKKAKKENILDIDIDTVWGRGYRLLDSSNVENVAVKIA